MGRKREGSGVKTIVHFLAVGAALLAVMAGSADARTSVTFFGEYKLGVVKPEGMVPLENGGWALFSNDDNTLVLMNAEFAETRRIDLKTSLQTPFSEVTRLVFNSALMKLYLLDASKKNIHVFDPEGTLLGTLSLDISKPVKISDASALAVDAAGRIYVGDRGVGDIKAFSLEGVYLYSIVNPPDEKGKSPAINSIDISVTPEGDIAVLEQDGRSLMMYSRSGKPKEQIGLKGQYRDLYRFIALQDGGFIGYDGREQKVYQWDAEGNPVIVFGAKGKGRGMFNQIAGIGLDNGGKALVLDKSTGVAQAFEFSEAPERFNDKTPPIVFNVERRKDKPFSSRLVRLYENGVVYFDKVSARMEIDAGNGVETLSHPGLSDVTAAFLTDRYTYVFDRKSCKVLAFKTGSDEFAFDFGGKGKCQGCLGEVTKILSAENNLYLADRKSTRINIYSLDGVFIDSIGKKGKEQPDEIGDVMDIAWYYDNLAVLDSGRNQIKLFDKKGAHIVNIEPRFPFDTVELTALDVDANGFLIVADRKNAQVYLFDDAGRIHFRFGSDGYRYFDWSSPENVFVDDAGNMMLVDAGKESRLMRYYLRTANMPERVESAILENDWADAKKLVDTYFAKQASAGTSGGEEYDAMLRLAVQVTIEVDADHSEAFKLIEKNKTAFTKPEDRRNLGVWYAKIGYFKEGVTLLKELLAEEPDSVPTRLALATIHQNAGELVAALKIVNEGLKRGPDKELQEFYTLGLGKLDSETSGRAIIQIEEYNPPPIFPAIYQSYYDIPDMILKVSNEGGQKSPPARILFYAQEIMNNPTETELPSIDPFSSVTVHLRSAFNRNILTYVEPTRMSANVEVRFSQMELAGNIRKNVTFQLMGRNNIDWKRDEMIACFITPNDPDVQVFARRALKVAGETSIKSTIDENLYSALVLYDAMQSVGIYYKPDPTQPFSFHQFSSGGALDSLQYPRETLQRQSGDCDDLSALYASLLEGSGIRTIMITSPGHIFTGFALKDARQAQESLGISEDMLIEFDGEYFVPVETTLIGSPFISAWGVAANIIKQYSDDNQIGIIDIKKAWSEYQTVSLPPEDKVVPLPEQTALAEMLQWELNALNLKQVEKRLDIYKRLLAYDPANLDLLIFLTRYYAEYGLFDSAREYLEKARRLDPRNVTVLMVEGNLAYLQQDFKSAITAYTAAYEKERNAAAQINMALSMLKAGELSSARKAFKTAGEINSGLVETYPELRQLLE